MKVRLIRIEIDGKVTVLITVLIDTQQNPIDIFIQFFGPDRLETIKADIRVGYANNLDIGKRRFGGCVRNHAV